MLELMLTLAQKISRQGKNGEFYLYLECVYPDCSQNCPWLFPNNNNNNQSLVHFLLCLFICSFLLSIPQVPTASTTADPNIALNKCLWHQSGHQIAVGGDLGKVYIYDVGEVGPSYHSKGPFTLPNFVHT